MSDQARSGQAWRVTDEGPACSARARPVAASRRRLRGLARGCDRQRPGATTGTTATSVARPRRPARRGFVSSSPWPPGTLDLPVQDAAAALGGQGRCCSAGSPQPTPHATTSSRVARGPRLVGHLPGACTTRPRSTIGGSPTSSAAATAPRSSTTIVRVDPPPARARGVGHLPAASSDSAAAAIGGTAYVVGGYTGTRWLDTIVAWRPGAARARRRAPPVAAPLRGGRGGRRQARDRGRLAPGRHGERRRLRVHARASRAVRIGRLPAPTTHAAAAAIGIDRLRDRRPRRRRRHADRQDRRASTSRTRAGRASRARCRRRAPT